MCFNFSATGQVREDKNLDELNQDVMCLAH